MRLAGEQAQGTEAEHHRTANAIAGCAIDVHCAWDRPAGRGFGSVHVGVGSMVLMYVVTEVTDRHRVLVATVWRSHSPYGL